MNDQKIEELLKKSLKQNEEVWTLTTQEKLLHKLEPYDQPKVDLKSLSSSPKDPSLLLKLLFLVLGAISFAIGLSLWFR